MILSSLSSFTFRQNESPCVLIGSFMLMLDNARCSIILMWASVAVFFSTHVHVILLVPVPHATFIALTFLHFRDSPVMPCCLCDGVASNLQLFTISSYPNTKVILPLSPNASVLGLHLKPSLYCSVIRVEMYLEYII